MVYMPRFSIFMNRFSRIPGRVILPLLVAFAWPEAGAETWTNSLGRSFEADFLRLHGDEAIFKMTNGRVFAKPLKELSPRSRARIASGETGGRQALVVPTGSHSSASRRSSRLPVGRSSSNNLGHRWRGEVRVDAGSRSRVMSEDKDKRCFVYESPSYRFTSNARITDDALRNFSMIFECTHKYARAIPLGLNGGRRVGGKLDIRLFESVQDYQRAGGPPGSAGVYNSRSGMVMALFASIGLEQGESGYSRDHGRNNMVLVHELVHQVTPGCYFRSGALGWFSEGVAEYVAVSPYTWGRFGSDKHGDAVKAFVTGYGPEGRGGRCLGTKLTVPKLKRFFLMPYSEFAGRNANLNYGFALLLNHYFFHMEGGGGARRITAFLRGMHAGQSGEAALKPLLGGSSYEALEKDVAAQWGRLGVGIGF